MRRMSEAVVATVAALHDVWPDLRGAALLGLDLRNEPLDWAAANVDGAIVLGCRLPPGVGDELIARGVGVFGGLDALPFAPYRERALHLRRARRGRDRGRGVHLRRRASVRGSSTSSLSVRDGVIRAVHDATVDAAVARFVVGRRVVGVMGGHALDRDADLYRKVAVTGRALTRAGFTIATGGGPGVMEAANLGAWMAPCADDALDDALDDARPGAALRGRPGGVRARRARCARPLAAAVARASACPRGSTCTSRRARSRRTSRSTSRTASARTACSRSRARASCTRRAVRGPSRRSSPTPRRTASRSTRCAARWCSSAARSSKREHPELVDRGPPAGRRVRLGRAVHGVRHARRSRGVHRRARSRRRGRRRRRAPPPAREHLNVPAPVVRAPAVVPPFGEAFAAHPRRVRRAGRVSRRRSLAEAAAVVAARAGHAAGRRRGARRRARHPVRDDRPARQHGPRPGVPRRTAGERLPRALRDRRRRRVRRARRRARPRVVRTRRHAVPPRRSRADAARRARRRRGQPAPRRRNGPRSCGRSISTRRASRRPRGSNARPCAAGPGSTTRACRPRSTRATPTSRSRCCARSDAPARRARSGARRREPRPAVAGGHARRERRVHARVRRAAVRSRDGTRRSRCSPAWKRPRS